MQDAVHDARDKEAGDGEGASEVSQLVRECEWRVLSQSGLKEESSGVEVRTWSWRAGRETQQAPDSPK